MMKIRGLFLVVGFVSLGLATRIYAQESTSKSGTPDAPLPPVALTGPAVALRDALAAACSQTQPEFIRFLTARNKEAFARMTPTARVAFMKRFVLLNQPGKATLTTNPSGRPIVRCATPEVTTEMQIGGTELRDNLAFLPLELRNATDDAASDARQITMGMVREDGEWKLLSLGVLLLDIPALEVEWDAAEIESTEGGAIEALKKIAAAVEAYRNKYSRLPDTLANLAPPAHGSPTSEAAELLDADLAAGTKNGYTLRYVIVGASTLGAPAKYELSATPLQYGRTGQRSFFRDSNGVLHGADHKGAVGGPSDPTVE